jgi:hypothetical protein
VRIASSKEEAVKALMTMLEGRIEGDGMGKQGFNAGERSGDWAKQVEGAVEWGWVRW